MHELTQDPALRLFAACALILVLKMYFLGFYTAFLRGKHGISVNPEDERLQEKRGNKKKNAQPVTSHPEVERVGRVHRNGMENVPFFLALGLTAVVAGVPLLGLQICFIGFTVARLVYTFAYLNALQPWRSLSFGVGLMTNLALGVMTVIHVY